MASPSGGRAWATLFLCAVLAVACPPIGAAVGFPKELRLFPGEDYTVRVGSLLELRLGGHAAAPGLLARTENGVARLSGLSLGSHRLTLSLLGIPLRQARVDVVPEVEVIPGGQAIGVLLSPRGLIVVRTGPVVGKDGRRYEPARAAGIEPGDVIIEVAGQPLSGAAQLEAAVSAHGARRSELPIAVRRRGKRLMMRVRPVLAEDPLRGGDRYLIGLFLEDPAAGVGTLTFWEPGSRRYGALGHMIAGPGRLSAPIDDGRIVSAQIRGVQPGERGRPGEKLGLFDDADAPLGTIDQNTTFGIYGRLLRSPMTTPYGRAVPVALAHQVRPGPAEILTVLYGAAVERFEVRILSVSRQERPDGKGMVIQVTDPRLLTVTGGIVQGMSGSPILQDGRLVGAITHVFINDPTKGYGVLGEWMVYESGLGRPARPALYSEHDRGARVAQGRLCADWQDSAPVRRIAKYSYRIQPWAGEARWRPASSSSTITRNIAPCWATPWRSSRISNTSDRPMTGYPVGKGSSGPGPTLSSWTSRSPDWTAWGS